jgi:hypothetical protein
MPYTLASLAPYVLVPYAAISILGLHTFPYTLLSVPLDLS